MNKFSFVLLILTNPPVETGKTLGICCTAQVVLINTCLGFCYSQHADKSTAVGNKTGNPTITTTTTVLRPLDFVRDYPGKLEPER